MQGNGTVTRVTDTYTGEYESFGKNLARLNSDFRGWYRYKLAFAVETR